MNGQETKAKTCNYQEKRNARRVSNARSPYEGDGANTRAVFVSKCRKRGSEDGDIDALRI